MLITNNAAKVRLYDRLFKGAKPEARFQFERHGYFIADKRDSQPGKAVFSRAVTLLDAWQK